MGFFDRFKKDKGIELTAPMKGKCVSIKEVPDPTFAEEILGKGIAVIPQDGHVYAPAGITTADGAEILIHIGLDTVELKGEPFEQKVKEGQDVKKGDLLVVADLDKIKASGKETITPMIICNSDAYEQVETFTGKDVETTDAVMKLHPAK